jgi:hypothetical protein
MAKTIQISQIRFDQFNKMVEMLRTIRTYDVKKQVAELKRQGHTREEALDFCHKAIRNIAVHSRGISELKEVTNG